MLNCSATVPNVAVVLYYTVALRIYLRMYSISYVEPPILSKKGTCIMTIYPPMIQYSRIYE